MKAAIFYELGGPEVMQLEEVDDPQPGPTQPSYRWPPAASAGTTRPTARG